MRQKPVRLGSATDAEQIASRERCSVRPNAVIEPNPPPINLSYATILGLG
jgi:hypothetical protein